MTCSFKTVINLHKNPIGVYYKDKNNQFCI
jgi:hypothetical protein